MNTEPTNETAAAEPEVAVKADKPKAAKVAKPKAAKPVKVAKVAKVAKPKADKPKADKPKAAKAAKPVKAAKVAKPKAASEGKRGRVSAFAGKKIYKLVSKNPRREGTAGFASFALITNGMKYESYIEKGGRSGDLAFDVAHKYVEVK